MSRGLAFRRTCSSRTNDLRPTGWAVHCASLAAGGERCHPVGQGEWPIAPWTRPHRRLTAQPTPPRRSRRSTLPESGDLVKRLSPQSVPSCLERGHRAPQRVDPVDACGPRETERSATSGQAQVLVRGLIRCAAWGRRHVRASRADTTDVQRGRSIGGASPDRQSDAGGAARVGAVSDGVARQRLWRATTMRKPIERWHRLNSRAPEILQG